MEKKMLVNLTVKEFMSTLASNSPVPGGGSVAALSGATASNLIAMVASLTIGKKGYEDVWDEMIRIKAKMETIGMEFLAAIDEDAKSYANVIDCYKLPKCTEDQIALRSAAIQTTILEAARIPMGIAETAATLFDDAKFVIEKGNKNAASDGAVAALMARASVLGALYNVKINAVSIKDESIRNELFEKAAALETKAIRAEAEVLSMISYQ
jgi:methenyltetrahydrofolate cyclohydrolase